MTRRAEVREKAQNDLFCPNCGMDRPQSLEVITEQNKVAWRGCKRCWPMVIARGQVGTVADLCRLCDDRKPAAPPINTDALLG